MAENGHKNIKKLNVWSLKMKNLNDFIDFPNLNRYQNQEIKKLIRKSSDWKFSICDEESVEF